MSATYKIHPAIGIARVGNSDKWFLGPESLEPPSRPVHKSQPGRIERQAARFRIWRYEEGKPVEEVKASGETTIVWRVHLANRKAAFSLRNRDVAHRKRLILDAGETAITGAAEKCGPYELSGSFQGKGSQPQEVFLGEIRTDADGRLIVLGGRGRSFSPSGAECTRFDHNDDWCDDTSDGPVSASIWFKDGSRVEAESSWVIVAPPKYAPSVLDPCTLFDRVYEEMLHKFPDDGHFDPLLAQSRVSFRWHVYPVLERVVRQYWVRELGYRNYLDPEVFKHLKDKSSDQKRKQVFDELSADANGGKFRLPSWRKNVLERWKDGKFEADWEVPLKLPEPFVLDKAALDQCLGSILSPGLEAPIHVKGLYHAPFRIRREGGIAPGSLTEALSVPWQADFWGCQEGWAPTAPQRVFMDPQSKKQKPWHRGITDRREMVDDWNLMGYALSAGDDGKHPFVEKERHLEHE